jgi:hypothetical protein
LIFFLVDRPPVDLCLLPVFLMIFFPDYSTSAYSARLRFKIFLESYGM